MRSCLPPAALTDSFRGVNHAGAQGMNDKEIAALVKKTVKKASKPKANRRKTYDATLDVTRRPETDADTEAEELFKEMKKREF